MGLMGHTCDSSDDRTRTVELGGVEGKKKVQNKMEQRTS